MKHSRTILLGAAMALPLVAAPAVGLASDHSGYDQAMVQQASAHRWKGKNIVEGEAKNVNHQTGVMYMMAEGRQLKVHFPPQVLRSVDTGDDVSVELAYTKAPDMAAERAQTTSPTESPMAQHEETHPKNSGLEHGGATWTGEHTMPATVTNVDPSNGTVDVMSEGQNLALRFPTTSMQHLKQGDKIEIYLALRGGAPASSISR